MEFPVDWTVLMKENFDLSVLRNRIEGLPHYGATRDLQLSGRVLDAFKVSVGSTWLLSVWRLLSKLYSIWNPVDGRGGRGEKLSYSGDSQA